MDSACKKHWKDYERGEAAEYKPTAKEIAARKREAQKAKKRKEQEAAAFQKALSKVALPLSDKQIDTLFEFSLHHHGVSLQQPVVKLLGLEVVKKAEKSWSDSKKGTHGVRLRGHTSQVRHRPHGEDARRIRIVDAASVQLQLGI